MKKISNELIIGLIAIITILIFIWLFSFLKGNNLFNSNDRYYAVFNEIGGLEESGPVEINGYKAGTVRNIKFINDGSGRLIVTLGINKGYKLPVGTVAEISPETVLAGMKVRLIMGNSAVFHSNGDTLTSRLDRGLINNAMDDISPVIRKADRIMSDIDTLLTGLKPIITDEFRNDIKESSNNIKSVSSQLDSIIKKSGENISSLIANLDNFTELLRENSGVLDTTIKQFSVIASDLSDSEIKKSVNNFNDAVKETTLLLEKLNSGEGSAGLLLNDDSLYANLTLSLEKLNYILEDIKANPERYINFSVFGRKK